MIEDLNRHESGVNRLSTKMDFEWATTENIKKNVIGKLIEEEHK